MRSQLDVRLGVQVPQIAHLPPDVHSLAAAEDAIELADVYGVADGHPLDESQRITLRAGLGERADGSWAAAVVGDFKGRQGGGKSDAIAARELAGLILFDEPLIIHTAHEFSTANESFLRLVALFENWDDLRSKVRRTLYGAGTQSINLLSGQRILYKTRTAGAGRGFSKAALVVYDEAQHLMAEHVAASGPARLAYPNSQSWYAGSGGLATSKMTWRLRRRALSGAGGRLAYVEGTAESVTVGLDGQVISSSPDPSDRDAWAMANPGLGRWVSEEALESLYDELGPELFARECMCVWDPEIDDASPGVIPADAWARCAVADFKRGDRVAYSIDVSPDGASAAIAASDGLTGHVIEHGLGTAWVPGKMAEHLGRKRGPVFLDPRSPAGALLDRDGRLQGATDIATEAVSPQQHAQACGGLLAAVTFEGPDRRFQHTGQPHLDTAVRGATRRPYGDAWAWNRRSSSVDISPLVAVTLARWGFLSLPPQVSAYEDHDLVAL